MREVGLWSIGLDHLHAIEPRHGQYGGPVDLAAQTLHHWRRHLDQIVLVAELRRTRLQCVARHVGAVGESLPDHAALFQGHDQSRERCLGQVGRQEQVVKAGGARLVQIRQHFEAPVQGPDCLDLVIAHGLAVIG